MSQNPVRKIKAQVGLTRLAETSNLGIRHPIHLGNNPVLGIQLSNNNMAR